MLELPSFSCYTAAREEIMRILATVLLLTMTAIAQTPTTFHQKTMTVALERGKVGRFHLKGLPSDTKFHVHSDFPVTIAIISEGIDPRSAEDMQWALTLSPCKAEMVLDYTLDCTQESRLGMLLIVNMHKGRKRDVNAVTVTSMVPDYSDPKSFGK